jgi:hypothetical protein
MRTASFKSGHALVLTASILFLSNVASGQLPYNFTVNSSASGLDATLSLSASTSGTLIGNYDPNTTPTGTRTKPGVWGPFGDTENLPVNISLAGGFGNTVHTAPTGAFQLDLDLASGLLRIRNFGSNLLGSGPLTAPATVTLETESFRTRNPSSLYIGGVPIEIPVGSATLSQFSVTQTGGDAFGTLTETGPNTYSFAVAPLVDLTATFDFFGNPLEVPPTSVVFPLGGELVLSGNTALITSLQPLDFSQTQPIGQALPQYALDLPTIIPPGDTAHLLLNLTLDEIAASLSGTNTLVADGVLIPEPTAALLLLALAALRRRG